MFTLTIETEQAVLLGDTPEQEVARLLKAAANELLAGTRQGVFITQAGQIGSWALDGHE